jgi:hypothetical protein
MTFITKTKFPISSMRLNENTSPEPQMHVTTVCIYLIYKSMHTPIEGNEIRYKKSIEGQEARIYLKKLFLIGRKRVQSHKCITISITPLQIIIKHKCLVQPRSA